MEVKPAGSGIQFRTLFLFLRIFPDIIQAELNQRQFAVLIFRSSRYTEAQVKKIPSGNQGRQIDFSLFQIRCHQLIFFPVI